MNLDQITTECFILALFIRDDGQRFLLGSGAYAFKESQQHFDANTYANDVVEVQGNDGVFLAGQVRRPSAQSFDGYIGDATVAKADVEEYRKNFLAFFRKNYYYTVVYIFPNGEAIQRRKGFIVDAPEAKELYQFYPEYHIALNFEDINYYSYSEDESGQETYTKSASIPVVSAATSGGLIWDEYGAVSYWYSWITPVEIEGSEIEITNSAGVSAPLESVQLNGNTEQATYSGKNLISLGALSGSTTSGVAISYSGSELSMNGTTTAGNSFNALANLGVTLPAGTYTASLKTLSGGWTYPSSPSDADFALYILDAANVSSSHRLAGFAGRVSSTWWGRSTFTLSEATTLYFYGTFNTAGIVFSNLVMGFQIEQGSTATTYEPYTGGVPAPNPNYPQPINVVTGEQAIELSDENNQAQSYTVNLGQIELCKIGDYQDYIYKSDDDWYIHKETSKTTDTSGSTGITISGMKSGTDVYSFYGGTVSGTTLTYDSAITGVNTIYYVLATPTDTQITNSALINQLDTLAGAKLAVGENSIVTTAAGDNLPAILDLWYYTQIDYSSAGYAWEEGSGSGPVTVMVESIDRVYPVWQIHGPAVNPQLSVLTTGTTLSYAGTVSASQTLEIDMFAKTAKLNGTSVIGNVSGDWDYFSPGNNRVVYTTQNADAEASTIYWQEIVG